MALTVLDCIEHIRHRLGTTDDGAGLSHDLSGLDVVNNAGTWLTTAHRWKWLQRQSTTLDTVDGQGYLALPADFDSIVALDSTELAVSISPTTLARIAELEKLPSNPNTYEYAVEWSHTGDTPVAQLRLWPAPDDSTSGAFILYYRAKWAKRTDDNQEVFLPDFLHPLFIELCREWAVGWEESDEVPLDARLTALKAGSLWSGARQVDGRIQQSYGRLRNGIAQGRYFGENPRGYWEGGAIG